jgi:hypothetical protein
MHTNFSKPFIIQYPKIGESSLGYISLAEKENLPFIPKRLFWTYFTPEEVVRGGHAHLELQQILIAVAGKITISTELISGEKQDFILENPSQGVYLPKLCWSYQQHSHNAVQLCLASDEYVEEDYIRDYSQFLKLR